MFIKLLYKLSLVILYSLILCSFAQASELTKAQRMLIQQILKDEGMYKGSLDGILGVNSNNAINILKKKYSLKLNQSLTTEDLKKLLYRNANWKFQTAVVSDFSFDDTFDRVLGFMIEPYESYVDPPKKIPTVRINAGINGAL